MMKTNESHKLTLYIFTSLIAVTIAVGCASGSGSKTANEASTPTASPIAKPLIASLGEIFKSQGELLHLQGQRVLSINGSSPTVTLPNQSVRPFVAFVIESLKEDQSDLVISTDALSLSGMRVGMSFPKVYVEKDGKAIEIPSQEELHISRLSTCLRSVYSYPIRSVFRPGMKVVVVNNADGFDSSLGKVDTANQNFRLEKTTGLCTLVDVYPAHNARYEISLR
jgi:hypothetical protein